MSSSTTQSSPRTAVIVVTLVAVVVGAFYMWTYRLDPQIDFAPLYVVGHMWRTGASTDYYAREIVEYEEGFVVRTPDWFQQYAEDHGFKSHFPVTLYLYSPAFIPAFSLFTFLPYAVASKVVIALATAAFLIALWFSLRAELPTRLSAVILVVSIPALMFCEPVRWCLGTGQFTPFLFAGVWLSHELQSRGRPISAGCVLAVMAWSKFFPGLLVLHWALRKDLRALVSFGVAAVAVVAIGFVVAGVEGMTEYVAMLRQVGSGVLLLSLNQSVDAFLTRFDYSILASMDTLTVNVPSWVKITGLALKAAILFSWFIWIRRVGDDPEAGLVRGGACYLIAVMILLLPISWIHYYVFLIPLTVWLASGRAPVWFWIAFGVAAFLVFLPLNAPKPLTDIAIPLLGKARAETFIKVVFSSHLIGSVMALVLAHAKLSLASRQAPR